mmetsp:Transcript_24766/g.58756  ORF Transcript_24766/g.58756 Transcript_24766/m.58756 type:complete len:96 (+) Transcript_24766:64-351(+)
MYFYTSDLIGSRKRGPISSLDRHSPCILRRLGRHLAAATDQQQNYSNSYTKHHSTYNKRGGSVVGRSKSRFSETDLDVFGYCFYCFTLFLELLLV